MTKIEQFFYDHAGYTMIIEPVAETEQQGRERCAKELATAEQYALEENWHFDWDLDDVDCGHEAGVCDHAPEWCQLWSADRAFMLASLRGICGADDNYRRIVEAELAHEAMTANQS